MSFDLAVWNAARALTVDEAVATHAALCAATPAAHLVATRKIAAFYKQLTRRFPELDDDEERSPFAATLDWSEAALILPISFSRADEVTAFVLLAAAKAGLDVWDPQVGSLRSAHAPQPLPPAAPPPRLKPRDAEKELAARLLAPLSERGFVAGGKRKGNPIPLFSRVLGELEVSLSLARWNAQSVMMTVSARAPSLEAWLGDEPVIHSHLVYLHLDTGGAWQASIGQHAVCHRDCLEETLVNLPAELDALVLPLLHRLSTIPALDAAWHAHDTPTRVTRTRPHWHVVGTALALASNDPARARWHHEALREMQRVPGWAAEVSALLPAYEAMLARAR